MASSLERTTNTLARMSNVAKNNNSLPVFVFTSPQYDNSTAAGTAVTCSAGTLNVPSTVVPCMHLLYSSVLSSEKFVSYPYTDASLTTDAGPSLTAGVWHVEFTGKLTTDATSSPHAGVILTFQHGESDAAIVARSRLITSDSLGDEAIHCSGYINIAKDVTSKKVLEVYLTNDVAGLSIADVDIKNIRLTVTCISKQQ